MSTCNNMYNTVRNNQVVCILHIQMQAFELLIEAFVKWLDSRISKMIEMKVVKIVFGNASALEWPSHNRVNLIKYTLS